MIGQISGHTARSHLSHAVYIEYKSGSIKRGSQMIPLQRLDQNSTSLGKSPIFSVKNPITARPGSLIKIPATGVAIVAGFISAKHGQRNRVIGRLSQGLHPALH